MCSGGVGENGLDKSILDTQTVGDCGAIVLIIVVGTLARDTVQTKHDESIGPNSTRIRLETRPFSQIQRLAVRHTGQSVIVDMQLRRAVAVCTVCTTLYPRQILQYCAVH